MAYNICTIYYIVVLIYIKGVNSALYCGDDLCENGCCYDEETTRTFYCCPEETSLSPGVIIGIIIASAFGLCLMCCLCAWTRKVLQNNKDIPYVSLREERPGHTRSTNEQNTRDLNERNQPDDSRTSERFVYIRFLIARINIRRNREQNSEPVLPPTYDECTAPPPSYDSAVNSATGGSNPV
ncbi:uncharacterized protein LOC127711042 [Mytilus californianus]|uniref:uncharacterized protein LOC127711042 n=1 Tax=Mytilus californianus TaxID=6549 RepID=UPI0022481886|nr:uncharacterized protein LOC127711042 [Mytilus californianus]